MKERMTIKGFTLIELLVVIAIIAILAVVVVLVLNPTQLLAQSRDANRVSDFATLKNAISLYLVDTPVANLASSSSGGYNACYLSTISGVGTTTAKCGNVFTNTYSSGNASASATLYRLTDSRGWLPVNLSQLSYGSPLSALPVDPTNNATYYYAYAATITGGNFFELNTFMESTKYAAMAAADGGDHNNVYEVGTYPGLGL
jgi:prepilin-type N-terminal cleavage/methylation domain-containing protein